PRPDAPSPAAEPVRRAPRRLPRRRRHAPRQRAAGDLRIGPHYHAAAAARPRSRRRVAGRARGAGSRPLTRGGVTCRSSPARLPVTTSAHNRVGVIGGGLGGLAAACTLAARGYEVVMFEANAWLGGKAAELAEGGFRFDMGPTILTIPDVLRRVFAE